MSYNQKFSYLASGEEIDSENYVLVTFRVESNAALSDASKAMAIESSVGTWIDIPDLSKDIVAKYAAKVLSVLEDGEKKGTVKIAYPLGLFETDNMPQLLSIISGNLSSLSVIDDLKVMEVEFPQDYVMANKGPAFGLIGIRDKLRIYDRPLVSVVIKPKVGLSLQSFAKLAYEAWAGGADIVRDDENLTDQDICPFYERVNLVMQALREVEKVTGEKKMYIPNVTARISEMYARAKFVQEMGGIAVMVDLLSVGMSGVQFMRDQNLDLIIHGHRLSTGNYNGLSLMVMAKISRLAGIDFLHIPTSVGKKKEEKESVLDVNYFLRDSWHKLNSIMPVSSGGLHPGHIEKLFELLGKDQVINMGGGVLAHPMGAESGARTVRKAIEGVVNGKTLREISKESVELKAALDKWGVFGENAFEHENPYTNVYALVKTKKTEIEKKKEQIHSVSIMEPRGEI
ncbi:ribulose-bisphosphate carboxylase large subunit [Candidatus Dojkabacteria bacterium]|nr:ribulose-bisphosphate carboxylase large subunit [Candidatus Dojkabacteria bacterium]